MSTVKHSDEAVPDSAPMSEAKQFRIALWMKDNTGTPQEGEDGEGKADEKPKRKPKRKKKAVKAVDPPTGEVGPDEGVSAVGSLWGKDVAAATAGPQPGGLFSKLAPPTIPGLGATVAKPAGKKSGGSAKGSGRKDKEQTTKAAPAPTATTGNKLPAQPPKAASAAVVAGGLTPGRL